MTVVVPLIINKKIAITTAERLFLSRGILKTLPKNQTCLMMFQQRWYGIETLDKDGSLHEQMYLPR